MDLNLELGEQLNKLLIVCYNCYFFGFFWMDFVFCFFNSVIKIVQELLATPNAGHPLNEKAVCKVFIFGLILCLCVIVLYISVFIYVFVF